LASWKKIAHSVAEVRAAHAADDDTRLVAAFIKGDGDSFAALVDRHMPMVYKFTYRYVGNADAANDIVQDVFIKVWKNIKKFDPEKNFKTWLLTIAKNTALDSIKKKKAILFSKIEEGETDLDAFLAPYVEHADLRMRCCKKNRPKRPRPCAPGVEPVLSERAFIAVYRTSEIQGDRGDASGTHRYHQKQAPPRTHSIEKILTAPKPVLDSYTER